MEEKDSESDKRIMRDKKLFLERDVSDVLLLKAVFYLRKLGKRIQNFLECKNNFKINY